MTIREAVEFELKNTLNTSIPADVMLQRVALDYDLDDECQFNILEYLIFLIKEIEE